jgi:hypothetical protein
MPRQGAVRDHKTVYATMSPALYRFVVSISRWLYLCQNHGRCSGRWPLLALPHNQDPVAQGPVARDPTDSASLVELHYVLSNGYLPQ